MYGHDFQWNEDYCDVTAPIEAITLPKEVHALRQEVIDSLPSSLGLIFVNICNLAKLEDAEKDEDFRNENDDFGENSFNYAGENVELICPIMGHSNTTKYTWSKDGQLLRTGARINGQHQRINRWMLEIQNLFLNDDVGNYKCKVEGENNTKGEYIFKLKIQDDPRSLIFIEDHYEKNINPIVGDNTSLNCSYFSPSPSEFKWFKVIDGELQPLNVS